jgi:hypothetical protein
MKFCFLLEKTAAETIFMLQQAFKNDAFGKSQVCEWFSCFKNGNMSAEDLPRPGHPSTSRNEENIEKVRQVINEDRRKTIEQVSEETNVPWSSCQRILTEDLRMRRVFAKFVPRLLTEEQKDNRVNVCRDLKEELRNDPNFPRMKKTLKGKRFSHVDELKENTLMALKSIPCQEFQSCFQQWKKRWDKCIDSHGEYF